MKNGILLITLSTSLWAMADSSTGNYQIHILKPGENLSELLYSKDFKPLYGKNNWVEKVLEMNHLKSADAGKIKKGLPIILPQREALAVKVEDKVNLGQASRIHYGLLGNRISDHQNIFLDFTYSQKQTNLSSTNINQKENFRLGLTFKDKNTRTLGKFSWNPIASFGFESQGSTEFSNNDSYNASYDPTVDFTAAIEIAHPSIDYKFAPYFTLRQISHLDEDGLNYNVRRDRLLSMGTKVFKTYEMNNILMSFAGSMGTTVLSQNLSGDKTMQIFDTKLEADVNLTRDYFIGVFWKGEQFNGTEIETASTTGLNLKYFIN